MVVKTRLRAFLFPFLLYVLVAAVTGYFFFHAHHGERGLEAKKALTFEIAHLEADLADLKSERADLERRSALLSVEQVDKDLLEEQARLILGRVHRNDVVIMTPAALQHENGALHH